MQNGSARVLVVEDDDAVRSMLRRVLRFNHYEVKEVTHFEEALTVIEQDCDFDVVLLDVNFPGGGGLRFLPLLKERCTEVPVIVVSAVEDDQVLQTLIRGGVQAVVPKPFEADQLLKRMESQIVRRNSGSE